MLGSAAPIATSGLRVGLLGGSFDPPHAAHRAISLTALKRLQLDAVWWLVSPGNPLKTSPSPLMDRLNAARSLADHPRILPTDFEARRGTRYTIDTIRALKRRWPDTRFVWIMGADNLCDAHRWKDWRGLFRAVPVAIVDRPGYRLKAYASRAAIAFARSRIDEADAAALPFSRPPAWSYLTAPLSSVSSTAIRAGHSQTELPTTY